MISCIHKPFEFTQDRYKGTQTQTCRCRQPSAVWCCAVGAHQVIQNGDGEIKHAHLDRLSESSVQVEQRLGFHSADWMLQLTTHTAIYTKKNQEREALKLGCSLPFTEDWITEKKRNPYMPFLLLFRGSNNCAPLASLLPTLYLVSSFIPSSSCSFSPSPGNVLTVSSCFLVFPSSRGIAQPLSCCARTTVLFAFSRLWMLRLIGSDLSQHRLNQTQNKNNNPCQTKCSSYTLRCNLNRQ